MALFPKSVTEYLALVGIPRGPKSKVYVVEAEHGDDDNPGTSFVSPLATLEAAEDLCVAGHHDVVILVASDHGDTLSAGLTWDKDYTHLIGYCAPTHAGQRSRIFCTAGDNAISPLINVTATGCIFRDLYIFHGVDDAHALVNVQVTGGRNVFENVHFAGGGHASNAISGCASLLLDGAEENFFKHCTLGVDTIGLAAAGNVLIFDSEAHRNVFEDCLFTMWASNNGAFFVKVADATGIDRYNIFKNCAFINTGTGLLSSFSIPAGMGAPRRLFLWNCLGFGSAKWDANDRGVLMGNMNAVTAADLSGVAVEMVV